MSRTSTNEYAIISPYSNTPDTSSTNYSALNFWEQWTSDIRRTYMPHDGTVTSMRIYLVTSQPNDGAVVFTVRKNWVDTTMTATITSNAAAQTIFSDVSHQIAFIAGDYLSIKMVNASPTGGASVLVSFGITSA